MKTNKGQTSVILKTAGLLLCFGVLLGHAALVAQKKSATASADVARQFLGSLTTEQRAKAAFTFADQERFDWWFIPRLRKGLMLEDMTPAQQQLAQKLLATGLSAKGVRETEQIRSLEVILKDLEAKDPPPRNPNVYAVRDPGAYYISIFGTPGPKDPWGWRFEGHHVSVNFTMVDGAVTAWTPEFRGANPAEVMDGPQKGLRVLKGPEDKAFALLHALDETQKKTAILQTETPRDIITSNKRTVELLSPAGLTAGRMTPAQKKILRDLLDEYTSRMADEVAAERMRRIDAAGFDNIGFAWVGADALHQPHYYRVQGPTFLIEFDEVQGNANHIHSVWREFTGDWGEDILKKHYETAHITSDK
jgi:hypothetical protein